MVKKVATKRKIVSVLKKYELMLILSPDLRESEADKKFKEIVGMMEKAGGKVTKEDMWGKKKFAYRIKKHNEGFYAVYNLELPNTFIKEFKDHLRIEKDVLRSMIISIPDDYVYTKYDLEGMAEESKIAKPAPKKEVKKETKEEVKKEVKEEKLEPKEVKEEKEEPKLDDKPVETQDPASEGEEKPKKEEPKSDLDKKLDALLDGDDLKL